jgi:hypothetical protein
VPLDAEQRRWLAAFVAAFVVLGAVLMTQAILGLRASVDALQGDLARRGAAVDCLLELSAGGSPSTGACTVVPAVSAASADARCDHAAGDTRTASRAGG